MKRKRKKYEAFDAVERRFRVRRCRHPPAERMPACKKAKFWFYFVGGCDRRPNSRRCDLWRIDSARPTFLERKVVTKRRDFLLGKILRDLLHRCRTHIGASAMTEHEQM